MHNNIIPREQRLPKEPLSYHRPQQMNREYFGLKVNLSSVLGRQLLKGSLQASSNQPAILLLHQQLGQEHNPTPSRIQQLDQLLQPLF